MSGLGNLEPVPIQTFRYLKGPLIDLRSPKEFSQGHWPGALNLPLFNNEERALVGKKYKETGEDFYKDKITLSKFYIEQLLPLSSIHTPSVYSDVDDLFLIDSKDF